MQARFDGGLGDCGVDGGVILGGAPAAPTGEIAPTLGGEKPVAAGTAGIAVTRGTAGGLDAATGGMVGTAAMAGGFTGATAGAIDGGTVDTRGRGGAATAGLAPGADGRAGGIAGGPLGPLSEGFDMRRLCYPAAAGMSRCEASCMPLLALMEF